MTRRQNLSSHVLYNTGLRPTETIRSDQVGGQGMRRTSQGIVTRLETKPARAGTHIYCPCMLRGCAGFANELWTASPCPGKASRHGTGSLAAWQVLRCSWKYPAVLQQLMFILFTYSVLCYESSIAACTQLCITIKITSDWSWHSNRAVGRILLQLQQTGKAEEGELCWSLGFFAVRCSRQSQHSEQIWLCYLPYISPKPQADFKASIWDKACGHVILKETVVCAFVNTSGRGKGTCMLWTVSFSYSNIF